MNGLPYYKRFPRDFMEGTIGMPFDLKGAYALVLDLIYMQGGRLPDDSRYIAGHLGCTTKAWTGYRAKLIEMGKLHVSGAHLTNNRADAELETLAKLSATQRQKRLGKSKYNGLPEPQFHQPEPEPEPEKKEEAIASVGHGASATALAIFNDAAARQGWPQASKITDARAKLIRARLCDVDGLLGWQALITKAEAARGLHRGATGPPTWFTFDWLLKPANFVKVLEGNYDRSFASRSDLNGHAGSPTGFTGFPGHGRPASIASIVAGNHARRAAGG